MPTIHLYARISHPDQRKGRGLDRQTSANVKDFALRHGFTLGKRVWVDDGVSAFKGSHRTPKHQLGQFLAEVRRGTIPAGDCLLVENWDRLSREDIWTAMGFIAELKEMKIHV